jgi:sugar phosphate isomerase/epimerase
VKLSLNTATVRKQWNLAQMIDGCARHGIRGISPWRDQVAAMGLNEAMKSIKSHGLTVTGLCRGGFFTAKDWQDDNRRAIDEAHELNAQCLALVVGGLAERSKDLISSRERVREGIATILPEARKASTSTTSGGTRSSSSRSDGRERSASSRITSATGWCRRATCSTTAA